MTDNSNVTTQAAQSANNSTLIEFPGVNRNRPAWRKELSERFREIQQQRRAREADHESEPVQRRPAPGQSFAPPDDARAAAAAPPTAPPKPNDSAAKQLGLVPAPDEPELNPIVAAALRRIERARASAPQPPAARQGSGRAQAATATARAVEEQPEQTNEQESAPAPQHSQRTDAAAGAQARRTSRRAEKAEAKAEAEAEAAHHASLVVVQPKQTLKAEASAHAPKAETAAPTAEAAEALPAARASATAAPTTTTGATPAVETYARAEVSEVARQEAATPDGSAEAQAGSRQPRHLSGVLDEFWLERQGIELLPKVLAPELTYDDRAPRAKRIAAAVVDLIAVAFLSAPFAAAIELTISNWGDPRVWGSMVLITALVMFLYHTCSIALAGRTLGMSLCALHAVDARKASVPTTGQCMRRAVVYMLSLATCGLGLLYSFFDAEGRTPHDILSGTVVVRK